MYAFSLSVPRFPPHLSSHLSLPSLIAECEMTHGMRESARHTQLSGNEKWCWCQRWNRPNHPWAELHNSNIILWLPPPLLSVIAALSSGTLSLAHSQFKQIWFLFLYVPVTSLLLRELCAGIGTRIKSPTIAKHVGKGQEEDRPKPTYSVYACEGVCRSVSVWAF